MNKSNIAHTLREEESNLILNAIKDLNLQSRTDLLHSVAKSIVKLDGELPKKIEQRLLEKKVQSMTPNERENYLNRFATLYLEAKDKNY